MFLKRQAHAKYKSSLSLNDYRHFSLYRTQYTFLSKKCHREFIARSKFHLKQNPRSFWKFMRKHRSSSFIPASMLHEGITSTNSLQTANLFSSYFSSVFSLVSLTPTPISSSFPQFFLPSNVQLSVIDVHKSLISLRGNKSLGPNGIQGDFLFNLRDIIAWPLSLLFNKSLATGTFPAILKIGSITPILKSGDSSYISNYRPITILPHISKLLKTIVLHTIRPSLNHVLLPEQHGFRPNRSTLTCNLVFTS